MAASSASHDSPLLEEYSIERLLPAHFPLLSVLYADALHLTILDNGAFHHAKSLQIPNN